MDNGLLAAISAIAVNTAGTIAGAITGAQRIADLAKRLDALEARVAKAEAAAEVAHVAADKAGRRLDDMARQSEVDAAADERQEFKSLLLAMAGEVRGLVAARRSSTPASTPIDPPRVGDGGRYSHGRKP